MLNHHICVYVDTTESHNPIFTHIIVMTTRSRYNNVVGQNLHLDSGISKQIPKYNKLIKICLICINIKSQHFMIWFDVYYYKMFMENIW